MFFYYSYKTFFGEDVKMERDWQKGLCESLSEGFCCEAFCCPCLMFGKIRKNLNPATSSTTQGAAYVVAEKVVGNSIGTVLEFLLRGEVRDVKNIGGNVVNDFCVTSFCGPCALTQMEYETREKEVEEKQPLKFTQTSVFKMDKFWENTMS
jgi:Cys-rich protein (TIGR01571 family)